MNKQLLLLSLVLMSLVSVHSETISVDTPPTEGEEPELPLEDNPPCSDANECLTLMDLDNLSQMVDNVEL